MLEVNDNKAIKGGFMKYQSLIRGAVVLGGIAFGSVAWAATPSASMLANTCAGCHGTDGVSNGPATPTIAGMSSEYFIESMKAYREGTRPATIMNRIAKGYSDEEIKAMAGYFAKQKFVRIQQDSDDKLAKKGKNLHKKYCEKCHEDGGRSADDGGILAGQMMPYLHYSFSDFMDGSRDMPKKMKRQVEKMHEAAGDEGIEELVNYYGSQK